MNKDGYNKIVSALERGGIAAEVTPVPEGSKHERYVTIQHTAKTDAEVLIALGQLMQLPKGGDPYGVEGPQLSPIPTGGSGITFEDMNNRR